MGRNGKKGVVCSSTFKQIISCRVRLYPDSDIALIKSSYADRSLLINLTPLRHLIAETKIGVHCLLYDRQ